MPYSPNIVRKAQYLESKYRKLLCEITDQRKLYPSEREYLAIFLRVATYQAVCQRILIRHLCLPPFNPILTQGN